MSIDLYMTGFVSSKYAKCAPYIKEVISLYPADNIIITRIMSNLRIRSEVMDIIPKQATNDIWAFKWQTEPIKIISYLSKTEFEQEVNKLDTIELESTSNHWNDRNFKSDEVCLSCPARHRMATDCFKQLFSFGQVYKGTKRILRMSDTIAFNSLEKLTQLTKGTILEEGINNILAQQDHILSKTIKDLTDYYNLRDKNIIEEASKHIVTKDRHKLTDVLLWAIVFRPSTNNQPYTSEEMEFLLPKLDTLIEACDEALPYCQTKNEIEEVISARQFFQGFYHQFEIGLRLELLVGVSA